MRTKLNLDALISDYLEFNEKRNVEDINFTIECNPSLRSKNIYNEKGKKVSTEYRCRESKELVVKKLFIEDYENKKIDIEFYWYDRFNEIFAKKVKVIDIEDNAQWESRFRKQRERIFDDLKGRAKTYGAEQYVDILYAFFKDEKQDFVETGSTMFSDAVKETLQIDPSTLSDKDKETIITIQTILNNSLDGKNKVYETLVYLTTI